MKKKKLLGINFLCGAVSILAFLVLWNIAVQGELGKMLPGPIPVLEKFFTSLVSGKIGQNTLVEHAFYSLLRVMAGYALGSVVGVILGLAMGTYKMVEAICSPLFRIIRPIPPIAWIPISIIWIGLGEDAKIFLIFLAYQAMTGGMDGLEDYYQVAGGLITVNSETAAALAIDPAVFESLGQVTTVTTTED